MYIQIHTEDHVIWPGDDHQREAILRGLTDRCQLHKLYHSHLSYLLYIKILCTSIGAVKQFPPTFERAEVAILYKSK